MSTETSPERRRFSRIPFHIEANLHSDNDGNYTACEVIDISLNGLLIVKPKGWTANSSVHFNVELLLENTPTIIYMDTAVAHIDDTTVGFICKHIDLASISHIKRLVELNLGDDTLLQRELSALIH
jgi:hypothetical protein